MSLATRCTACGTIFRVVQDQLRVSEGWVRCGRCAEVFDAREQLFDMDREAPPSWPAAFTPAEPPTPEPVPVAHVMAPAPVMPEPEVFAPPPIQAPAPVAAPDERVEPHWDAAPPLRTAEPEFYHEPIQIEPQARPEADADPASELAQPELKPTPRAKKLRGKGGPGAGRASAGSPPTPESYVPEFMRRAAGRERWRRPGVRVALASTSGFLGILLVAQMALHWRDAIAAAYPPARATLQALCAVRGCQVEPWRRIDVVSVENSALAQAGAGNQYQLSVSLRNKSGVEVALPWIDLSLTDPTGAVVVRRALSPADFHIANGPSGANSPSIAAGAEVPLQVLIGTGPQKVSGYSVEIFNP